MQFIQTDASITTSWPDWECPKHGNIGTAYMQITIRRENIHEYYCMYCLNELLSEKICKVTKIERG